MTQSKLALTKSALEQAKNVPALFEMPAFRKNCIANYQKTAGVTEEKAILKYERERVLFMKALTDNPQLASCDRFTIYASMVELFASGLSLNEGMTYIIPYKDKAQFQIGYLGRLEMMKQIPDVKFVDQPQAVYEGDDFKYELGDEVKVIRHIPGKRAKDARVTHVYMHVTYNSIGKKTYVMAAEEVYKIRDKYSDSYKYYARMLEQQKKKWGEKVKSQKGFLLDLPMWVDNEAEAFKKTIIKRVWKMMDKTPRQIALEKQLEGRPDPEEDDAGIDYGIPMESDGEEGNDDEYQDAKLVTDDGDVVDVETGEVDDNDDDDEDFKV